jgi:predicted branched-subunit amino acid permease
MTMFTTHRSDAVGGARAMAPWLVGVAPFGLVIGVSAARADVPTLAGVLTGPVIYSGSAQVATIALLDAGAAPLVIVLTALIINLRLILYSAAMAPHWRGTPWWWRAGAAYLLIDPSFAVGIDRYSRPGDQRRAHSYYLGGALILWVGWLAAIIIGAVAGAELPAQLHLEFVIPLYLVGEIVPRLGSPATRRAVGAAAVVAVAALAAPLHLGVAIAIVVGLAAGLTVRQTRTSSADVAR